MPAGPIALASLAALAAVLSAVLTGWARRYALRRGMVDQPSHRSSHDRPTPRGGGIALAAVILGFVAVAAWAGWLDTRVGLALGLGGSMVALIGWLDDHRSVPGLLRLLVHGTAAALAVSLIGGLERISIGSIHLPLGLFTFVVTWSAIVWLTNLYNFMDGIDGLAGAEALIVAMGAAILLSAAGAASLAALCAVIAGAAGGFLAWNWAPAKIFLGDVGSGLLGYSFAVLGLAADRAGAVGVTVWVTLLAVFAVDATVTLFRRLARGERVIDAHRSHAYQRMVQSGWTHARVTLAVVALNVMCFAAAAAMVVYPFVAPLIVAGLLMALAVVYLLVEFRFPMWAQRAETSPLSDPDGG